MTRHKKMQMLLSILVCDTMEKDAEKTVNRGVFDKKDSSEIWSDAFAPAGRV